MAATHPSLPLAARRRFGATARTDAWWIKPLAVFAGLGAFVVYTTWAAFQGEHYRFGPYLSPLYSPELYASGRPSWFPGWLPWSPALLILWAPGGFRLTCYYYRGAYYKSFWADPPACTVGEPRRSYRGESSFPLIVQNVHRYFLYLALLFLVFLAHDVWLALWFDDPSTGQARLGLGVGSLVLALNVFLLGGYALGCHSLRHLVGGGLDRPSERPLRYSAWRCVSCLNGRHMAWAWASLVWVGFSDLYVRLCSMGLWSDWRIF
jgi:hypothetical protein